LHRLGRHVNICSMQNRPTRNARDEAILAALRDAAVLAEIMADEFHSTYEGQERAEYLRVLTDTVTDLGGSLEQSRTGIAATFSGRRIAIRFGAGRGHR
jgi:hypothetical protein